MKPHWTGVFPAITTQMHKSGAIDLDATARHAEVLIASGVSGLVFLGSLAMQASLVPFGTSMVLISSAGDSAGKVVSGFQPSSFCANKTPPAMRTRIARSVETMRFKAMVSYSTTTTGFPSTSIFGVMPRPGAVLADMKPFKIGRAHV